MNEKSPESNEDLESLDPDGLLSHFSHTSIGRWLVIALLVHVVLIGATSVSTIRALVDEEYAAKIAEAEEKAKQGEAGDEVEEAIEQGRKAGEADGEEADGEEADGEEAGEGEADEPAEDADPEGEEETKSPVEARVEETADPDEIPERPDDDDLGISLDETQFEE